MTCPDLQIITHYLDNASRYMTMAWAVRLTNGSQSSFWSGLGFEQFVIAAEKLGYRLEPILPAELARQIHEARVIGADDRTLPETVGFR